MAEECVDLPVITEVTMLRVVELRRHSAGKASSGNNEEKVVPHYLRASTGSCHDFCKYGRKQALEAKEKKSIPKRAERKSLHQSFKVDATSKPTSKRVGTSFISSSKKEEPPLKSTSERVKTHPKSTSQMVKTPSKSASKMMRTSCKLSSFEDKEMNVSEKHVTSLNLDPCKVASPLRASLSSKSSHKRTASINMLKSLKTASHLKDQPKPREVKPKEDNNEAQEKTLYVIKVESENQTFQSDQNTSQDIELSPSHALSSPKFSSSSISQFSSQEDQKDSEYASSEFEEDSSSGNHGIEYMQNLEILEVEENGKPQEDGAEFFEDKDCQKLRGKLFETQIEKSSPRRVKFRSGKVLGDNATDVKADADNNGAVAGPEKVVLRHQDVQDKKDGQILLNNVIEETASKLVETQKSKVKALVGAFETVISLQEKKPFANLIN